MRKNALQELREKMKKIKKEHHEAVKKDVKKRFGIDLKDKDLRGRH